MITTFFGVSSWPSAASSLSDSFTASCTKALIWPLAERLQRGVAEAAAEALHPRDARAPSRRRSGRRRGMCTPTLAARRRSPSTCAVLVVVVAEHRGARDAQRRRAPRPATLRLLEQPAIGQIAAQQQDVRLGVHLLHELAEAAVVVLPAVQVTDRRQPNLRARIPWPLLRLRRLSLAPLRPTARPSPIAPVVDVHAGSSPCEIRLPRQSCSSQLPSRTVSSVRRQQLRHHPVRHVSRSAG